MAVSGIEIFKKLPKTNCKECGHPTCLAFAMAVASGKLSIEECPHVSEQTKAELLDAAAPPVRGVTLGKDLRVGEEEVLFRHEKRFNNPTVFALLFYEGEESVEEKCKKLSKSFERVGVCMRTQMAAAVYKEDKDAYISLVKRLCKEDVALMLICQNPTVLKEAIKECEGKRPLIHAATMQNKEEMLKIAKEHNLPIVLKDEEIQNLSTLSNFFFSSGVKDILLDPLAESVQEAFTKCTLLRRAAVLERNRALGYPIFLCTKRLSEDPLYQTLYAGVLLPRYASVIALSDIEPHHIFPLYVERLNIFTDPQRPMMVKEGIYPINGPGDESCAIVTVNFSLTYFIVAGEVESSRVPTWLCIMDTEGLSTLTAWAAGKFVPDAIARFLRRHRLEEHISHKKIIIPGLVAQISGELEEELGQGWKVVVGPREASELPSFLQKLSL